MSALGGVSAPGVCVWSWGVSGLGGVGAVSALGGCLLLGGVWSGGCLFLVGCLLLGGVCSGGPGLVGGCLLLCVGGCLFLGGDGVVSKHALMQTAL